MKSFIEEAKDLLKFWGDKNIELRFDRRRRIIGMSDLKARRIIINPDNVTNIHALRLLVLHEIGHFQFPNTKTDEDSEYLAHTFALNAIRQFYPKSLNYAWKSLVETIDYIEKNDELMREYGDHYKAYRRIYEESKSL